MKKFSFPLQSLLDWRVAQADIEKAKLRGIFLERRTIEANREAVRTAGVTARGELYGRTSITGGELAALASYQASLVREGRILEKRSRDCDARAEAQRQCLLGAERARRLIERFKERRLEDWTYEMNRELESNAADCYLAKFKR